MVVFLVLVVYLIIDGIVASYMKQVAYLKGYDDNAHTFAICFWLGLPGWLYVVALPDLVARKNQETIVKLLANNPTQVSEELPEL